MVRGREGTAMRGEALRQRAARVAAWPTPRRPLVEASLLALSLALCLAAVAGLLG